MIWFRAYELVKQVGVWVWGITINTRCSKCILILTCVLYMSDVETVCRVRRKYSLGSSVDLVRTQLCLNRHIILRLPIIKGMTGQLYLTWVCVTSGRWSWGRTCFVRVSCRASSVLIKNTSFPPHAASSAHRMRAFSWKTTNAGKTTACVYF